MRFSIASALVALVSSVVAQDPAFNIINAPAQDQEVAVGSTFTVKWTLGSKVGSGKVKLVLTGGKDFATLVPKGSIATGVDNSALKFDWLVDAKAAGDASYGIQIVDEADSTLWQWSKNFKIVGGSSASSSSASSTASSSSAASQMSTTTTTSSKGSTLMTTTTSMSSPKPTFAVNSTTTTGPTPSGNGTNPGPSPTAPRPAAGAQGAVVNAAVIIGGLAIAAFAL